MEPADDRPEVSDVAVRSDWTVLRCEHGMLHLQLGRVTLDFSASEFHDLAVLIGHAYVRFGVRHASRDGGPTH